MAFLQWRRFQFFDREILRSTTESSYEMTESMLLDPNAVPTEEDATSILDESVVSPSSVSALDRLRDIKVTCTDSGCGQLIIGDEDGIIHLIDRHFGHSSFRAFEQTVSQIKCVSSNSSFVVTIGTDDPEDKRQLIKVWNLDKWISHEDGAKPHCIRSAATHNNVNNKEPARVTCLTVAEKLYYLALGLSDGTILLIRNDVTREKFAKQRIIPVSTVPITNIEFGDVSVVNYKRMDAINTLLSSMERGPTAVLFASTADQIFSFIIRKDKEEKCVLDDELGALPGCAVCLLDTKRLSSNDSPTTGNNLNNNTNSNNNSSHNNNTNQPSKLFAVGRVDAVYFYQSDARAQCLVFEGDKCLLIAFRSFLITIGKEKRSFHPFASDSANKLPSASAVTPETAAITPVMDLYNVTIYDLANRFVAFTSTVQSVQGVLSEWGLVFILTIDGKLIQLKEKDIQSKLKLLFKKSQFSLAVDLAKSYGYDEDEISDITKQYAEQLYKKGEFDASVAQFIKTIGYLEPSYVIRKFLDARRITNLTSYLKALLAKDLANEDHTTLLVNCYAKLKEDSQLNQLIESGLEFDVETVIKVLRNSGFNQHAARLALKASKIDLYLSIELEDLDAAEDALKFLIHSIEKEHRLWYLVHYGRQLMVKIPDETATLVKTTVSQFIENSSSFVFPSNSPFKLEDSLNIYLKHPDHLLEFLEHITKTYPNVAPPLFYQTLLDLYLKRFSSLGEKETDPNGRGAIDVKLMSLLQSPEGKYDQEQALLQCHLYKFTPGLLYLYKQTAREMLIQQFYVNDHNAQGVVDSATSSELVNNALWYFADNQGTPEQICTLLKKAQQDHSIPAIQVINILSKNHQNTLSGVRDFLIDWFKKEDEQIEKNLKDIVENEEETKKRKEEITQITNSPRVFQSSRCSICSDLLELPAVHFYCGHSYHKICIESYTDSLSDSDFDCFHCAKDNKQILGLLKNRTKRDLNDRIKEQILRPDVDPISTLASLIAKGVFSNKK